MAPNNLQKNNQYMETGADLGFNHKGAKHTLIIGRVLYKYTKYQIKRYICSPDVGTAFGFALPSGVLNPNYNDNRPMMSP
jgi:hypothetical protein